MSTEFCNAFFSQYLSYEPQTGTFLWIVDKGPKRAGDEAGTTMTTYGKTTDYRTIRINSRGYYAHRLAWVMSGNTIPEGYEIDHIDGDGLNNRLDNLRCVLPTINQRNRRLNRNNKSGTSGVNWNRHRNCWSCFIKLDGRQKNLGNFTLKEDAIKARMAAQMSNQFHENHGRVAA